MELLLLLALLAVLYFVFFKKPQKQGAFEFSDPIPAGYQIYNKSAQLVGIKYRKDDFLKFAHSDEQALEIELEPGNPKDPNAIKVIGTTKTGRYFIGYLPKEDARQIVNSGLAASVKARLMQIYIGKNGYVDMRWQIIGPKKDKKHFDSFQS
ncbi:HIRAN domain-containing protein [Flavobacterium sp.]|jgi:hypothetical protein|uniref:HIRAN domain-containing protein n=1 Tax=Flavobacterium sp. TaxID=239 RepID=UPI0037BE68F2